MESYYELIEPYILSKVSSLTEMDLINAIQGFYNPKLTKRFLILDHLEKMLLKQADSITLEAAGNLLYFYSKNRFGGRLLIEALKRRIVSHDLKVDKEISTETLM
jgi:hypothetical protein